MGEQAPILEGNDVFGDVLKLGDHVRGDEEGAPGAASLHGVGGQREDLLVEGVSGGNVQGCLDLIEERDGRTRGQRDGAGQDGNLTRGHLAQFLAPLQPESKTMGVVVE